MRLNHQVLPDLSGFEAEEVGRVRELIEEHAQKRGEWYAQKKLHEEARASLSEAQGRDQRERAAALRASKKDPGHKHEEKARAEMAEIENRMGVLEVVVLADIERDLSAALTEAKPALMRESKERVERARERFNEGVRAMREAHDAWTVETGLARWCENPSSHVSPGPPVIAVLSVEEIPAEQDEREGTVRLVG